MTPSSRIRLGAVAGAGVLVLTTGCGVTAESLHPGAAARVDGDTISMTTLDAATQAFCDWNKTDASTPLLTGYAGRTAMLEGLVVRSVADDMNAATYHKEPGAFYDAQVNAAKQSVAGLSPAQVDAVLPALTGYAYFVDLVGQFGATPSTPAPTTAQEAIAAMQKGLPLVVAWAKDHPITTDPSLPGITVDPAVIVSTTDQGLSRAASTFAQTAVEATQPTPTGDATAFPSTLPESQRCG